MSRKRIGMGAGKGKGWSNIIASDSYRHKLSQMGIKSTQVSLSKTKKQRLKETLLPLLANRTITGYNLVENPHARPINKFRLIYGHDSIKHRKMLMRLLEDLNLEYYVVPRNASFLSDESFIKTANQIKTGDIITNDNEYQIVFDVDNDQLAKLEDTIRKRAVNYDFYVNFLDSYTNPTQTLPEVAITESYTVPDVRIKGKKKYRDFKKVDLIRKKLDKNTDLVILSLGQKTSQLRQALKGETEEKILVQDYSPTKHSFYEFLKKI